MEPQRLLAEIETLILNASGATNQEAGRKLVIVSSTVKKHLENNYARLGSTVGWRRSAGRELKLL